MYEEFITLKNPMDAFIAWLEPERYIVSLEKGKNDKYNHYQIGIETNKKINSIRMKIDRTFKPHLSSRTITLNIWRKVKIHNMKVSLIGYCAKEGNIYKTNLYDKLIKEELDKYILQTAKPEIIQIIYCQKKYCICGNYGCILKPRSSRV